MSQGLEPHCHLKLAQVLISSIVGEKWANLYDAHFSPHYIATDEYLGQLKDDNKAPDPETVMINGWVKMCKPGPPCLS